MSTILILPHGLAKLGDYSNKGWGELKFCHNAKEKFKSLHFPIRLQQNERVFHKGRKGDKSPEAGDSCKIGIMRDSRTSKN